MHIIHTYNTHSIQAWRTYLYDFEEYQKMLFLVPVLTLGHAICGFVLRKIVLALSQALKTSKIHRFERFKVHNSIFSKQMSNINFARCYPMLKNTLISAILAILLETFYLFLWFPFLPRKSGGILPAKL